MSGQGKCLDNAVAESFFGDLTWHCDFKDRDEAHSAIFDYIEVLYDRERAHQTRGYVSPVVYEHQAVH